MLLRIRADLSAAIEAPNIDAEDIKAVLGDLNRAEIGNLSQINEALAELRHANRLNYALRDITSRIYIGAKQQNQPFRLSDDVSVNISPVSEADALYLSSGTIHLDEVKNTANALRGKLEQTPDQLRNMVRWREAASDGGPPREVGVHIETTERWTDINRPLAGYPRGSYTLQELISQRIPLQIGPYRLSVEKMIELRDAILSKARELGEFPPNDAFFARIRTLEDAERVLEIDL
ncbi:MAG: hypothetical protein F6K42_00245 [Leptolyngbya sp. SIO1D8]|nr:hypothetical protein [Leptolyngbya sp. SIO1D8]